MIRADNEIPIFCHFFKGNGLNISEKTNDRWELIVSSVDEFGYLSVNQLSELCHASDITIRRDLEKLHQRKRLQRTHGGAASILKNRQAALAMPDRSDDEHLSSPGAILGQVDAIIATTHFPEQDSMVIQGIRKNIPIIAEALPVSNMITCVAIDNYLGGVMLGRWAGEYARRHWGGRVKVLDLTYHLPNTQQRSSGFKAGLCEVISECKDTLSLNAYSRYDTAYQLTQDALRIDRDINIIFTINDTNAAGALNACKDMGMDRDKLIIVSFGLDGTTARNALADGDYYRAGLAMFPELVGPACVEAAIAAFNSHPLPRQFQTPFAVITRENMHEYYQRSGSGWQLRWDQAVRLLPLPCEYNQPHAAEKIPQHIGVVIRFGEHEWYQNLFKAMQDYGLQYGIDCKLIDFEQTLREEVELCRREIGRCAAGQVQPGDVILIDGGPISAYMAEALVDHQNITVISNSMPVLEKLKGHPGITLISIGGALRHSSEVFVGPTAENSLREFRADKLFLMVTGISPSFGLSHTNISEVTIKQNMIRSAREVILLADHTCFGRESTIQVAPLSLAHKLITDDALPASSRIELTRQGLQIIVAGMC
jgi:DeoR/GlpR family transcriptional regulator of sugar metabolism/ABC-type sugar transport system substrate-binding protein